MTSVVSENRKRVLTMAEYIEREVLYEKAYWHGEHPDVDNPFPDGVDAIDIKDVDAIPSADVAPVRHGRWVDNGIPNSILSGCSVCGFTCGSSSFFYCPNCGAKMDGGDGNSAICSKTI